MGEEWSQKIYEELLKIKDKLEKTLQGRAGLRVHDREGHLYMLQTRTGKRTAVAAVTYCGSKWSRRS